MFLGTDILNPLADCRPPIKYSCVRLAGTENLKERLLEPGQLDWVVLGYLERKYLAWRIITRTLLTVLFQSWQLIT